MEPAVTQQRHVSFYLGAMGGHHTLPVPAGGELVVTDSPGHSIGTFPHERGEAYSWYLCPCQNRSDPAAWRVTGPADFHCKLCKVAPKAITVCTCGIVSPVDEQIACGWCGRAPHGVSHTCRGVGGGIPIYFDGPTCPLCGEAAVAKPPSPVTPAPAATARSTEATIEVSALPTAIASRLAQAATTKPKTQLQARPAPAAPATMAAPPQSAIQPAQPTATPRSKPRPATAWLAAIALALCAFLAWALAEWSHRHTTYARALTALEHGDVFEPPGSSAIDLYGRLAQEEPGSANLQDLGRRISGVVRPSADAQLQRFFAESPDDTPWPRLAASYAFLARAAPTDKEALARQRYCDAQVAFSHGDYREARDGYQAALGLHPQWAPALNGLGRVHVRAAPPLRDYDAARREYLAAHQADPQFIFPLVNLARLAPLLHLPSEAPGYLWQAIAISPKDAKLYQDLGQIFVQLHQKREAIRAYRDCLRYATDPVLRARVESALRKLGANPDAAAGMAP